jgi:potassium/chloride transporter 8
VNWLSPQAVGCALYVLGFGESMAGLVGLSSPWAERGFAGAAVLLLGMINVAGVKWVIKLQFVLLLILLLAGVDFAVGSFIHTDVGKARNLKLLHFNLYDVFVCMYLFVTDRLVQLQSIIDLNHF